VASFTRFVSEDDGHDDAELAARAVSAAQAGNLDAEGTVRLAAIRQELTARGEQLEPVRPGSSGW
jgi:hypothetical protein